MLYSSIVYKCEVCEAFPTISNATVYNVEHNICVRCHAIHRNPPSNTTNTHDSAFMIVYSNTKLSFLSEFFLPARHL